MTNIFNFPPKKSGDTDGDFLQDSSELVQFDASGRDVDLTSTDQPISDHLSRDWSNQELASIYRVKRLLDAAGVPNQLERSQSDEGDPWCVFLNQAGDVFIHLGRIDGLYVLDSPNLEKPIFGRDFTDLISQFSEGALRESDKAAKVRRRLIKLERGGKIFLHPSALLAALIWSVYLNSEDLVLFVPEEDDDAAFDAELAIAQLNSAAETLSAEDLALEAQFMEPLAANGQMIAARTGDLDSADDSDRQGPFYKDLISKTGLAIAPTSIAVGLSSIAIAYGFLSDSYFEDDPAPSQDLALGDDAETLVDTAEVDRDETSLPVAPPEFDLTAVLDTILDAGADALAEEDLIAPDGSARIDVASLLEITLEIPDISEPMSRFEDVVAHADLPVDPAPVALVVPETTSEAEAGLPKNILSSEPAAETPEPLVTEVLPLAPDFFSIADLRDSFSDRLTEFSVGDTQFKASFDIASLSIETSRMIDSTLSFEMPTQAEADMPDPMVSETSDILTSFFQRPTSPDLINDNAISFIAYLMEKGSNVQVMSRAEEIVLIDFSAFGNGDVYDMSWDLEHGGTVKTIGLKTEFFEFDLIA